MLRHRCFIVMIALLAVGIGTARALEPPTREQLERYRLDGTLAVRAEDARELGNHRLAPQLVARMIPDASVKSVPDTPTVLPSAGTSRVLALLIAFSDMPGSSDPAVVDDMLYGDGDPTLFPYESLAAFYQRSSYGQLEITGSTLGWYTTAYPRDEVVETTSGREALIREVINHYDLEGHDFTQYDNDGDGVVDYFVVIWTGPHGEWAEFWWGYQTRFRGTNFSVDGVRLGTYSWQWENYDWPGTFSPEVVIHETGHALGLPDYYDYDDSIGPRGGVGGLDQMASNWGDHNAFSKWVLGWLSPEVYNQDEHELLLAPSDSVPEAAVLMHGDPVADPYAEYFVVQHRRRQGNDAEIPADGLLIWHVDARVDGNGRLLYDNSYTEHKLLRLMEADGLEEIETGGRADAGDFYTPGDVFDTVSRPSSHRYDGVPTNLAVSEIAFAGADISVNADLGSGCAIWCDAVVGTTAWPGLPVPFQGSLSTANCQDTPTFLWTFGDGGSSGDTTLSHAYVGAGSYDWNVTAALGDAACGHHGVVEVCTDFPCWQWIALAPMAYGRAGHAAVELGDGTILVVGGQEPGSEIYDIAADHWSTGPEPVGVWGLSRGVRLTDGRALIVGLGDEGAVSEIYDPSTGSFSATGPLNHDRMYFGLAALDDGRAVVAGGVLWDSGVATPVEEVEVFDPVSGGWTDVDVIDGELMNPAMTALSDGRVLIVGGRAVTAFDPATNTVDRATPLPAGWSSPLAVGLLDGRVLLSDIVGTAITLVWDPGDGRLQIAGKPSVRRSYSSWSTLGNGLVLVTGGYDDTGTCLASTEVFDPSSLSWSAGSSLITARAAHSAHLTSDGRLLLIGGLATLDPITSTTPTVEQLTEPTSPPRRPRGRSSP